MSLDLKDAFFHIQVALICRRFLRFAFEGVAYQYKVLPFGLSLAPCTFTRCMDAALSPLQMGIRILNYLDDWLMLAQSQAVFNVAQDPRPQPFRLPGAQGQLCQEHTVTQPTSSFLGTVIADDRNCLIGARQSQIFSSAVTQFLRGARRMNPPRPRTVPPWDLPTVLRALKGSPFKPLQRFLRPPPPCQGLESIY